MKTSNLTTVDEASTAINSPKISVVFLCYNQEAFVEEALNSALNQQYPDFEVIIGDDCSTDATAKVISKVLATNPNAWRAVRVEADKNLGISGNWNRAVQYVSGEYIVAMAGDDISMPGRLSAVRQAFMEFPAAAAVVSQVTVIDPLGRVIIPEFESSTRSKGLLEKSKTISGYTFWAEAPVLGASAAYRASLAKKFGPLIAGKSEDNAYFYRALLVGSICYLPAALVLWRWHGRNACHGGELGNFTTEAWAARMVSSKEDALANCKQYYVDADRARSLGIIDKDRLVEERQKIKLLEKQLFVALASVDSRYDFISLLMAIWRHIFAERFKIQSLAFGFRSLIKPLLPMSVRLRSTRRL